MSRLQIEDNQDWKAIKECIRSSQQDFDLETTKLDLKDIANKKISDKIVDNPNFLFFPSDLHQRGDKIGESHIISMKDDMISTGNIMGFVGVNDTQLDIKSRFAQDDEDYFLHYMLQKVFAINLFDIKHTTNEQQIFDFLLYLFPYYLKKALAQGLFKKYRRFEHNDDNIRGPINISRYIRENIPFKGTVAYSTREHSYDNEITQLVRHTIEFIRTKQLGANILNNDMETKESVSQIVMATQTYNARERQKVINQNLRPIRHPYYSEYTPLQKICLQILRHESLKYGHEKDKVYGILFDGAWLWEEYLNTIFVKYQLGITHAKNKTGENGINLYENGRKCYYPDFYRKPNVPTKKTITSYTEMDESSRCRNCPTGETGFVLDAKYKRLGKDVIVDEQENSRNLQNSISICHDDLFQMITYMHVLPAKKCALVYPLERKEQSKNEIVKAHPRILMGYGGEITGYGIPIPEILSEQKYSNFCESMNKVESFLKEEIKTIISNNNSPN